MMRREICAARRVNPGLAKRRDHCLIPSPSSLPWEVGMERGFVVRRPDSLLRLFGSAALIYLLASCGGGGAGLVPDPAASKSAQISIRPVSIDFGEVAAGGRSSQVVTISNAGTADATVTEAKVTGNAFAISGISLPLALAAGASASFTVTFAPTAPGNFTGDISIGGDFPGAP